MQSDIGQMLLLVGRWCRSSHSNEGDSWFIKKRNDSAYDEVSIDKKICLRRQKGMTPK